MREAWRRGAHENGMSLRRSPPHVLRGEPHGEAREVQTNAALPPVELGEDVRAEALGPVNARPPWIREAGAGRIRDRGGNEARVGGGVQGGQEGRRERPQRGQGAAGDLGGESLAGPE